MKPKKKSNVDAVIAFICLLGTIYFTLQLAASWNYAHETNSGANNMEIFQVFLNQASVRIEQNPFKFEFNEYTKPFFFGGMLIWFMGVAYYFTTRKNYIAGKEHGTARWGRKSDIQELFAENIEKEEIKKAKKVGKIWSRYGVKFEEVRIVKREIKTLKKQRFKDLTFEAEVKKVEGTYSNQAHKEKTKELKVEMKEMKELALLHAWKPDKYKVEYRKRLFEIENSPLLKEEEKIEEKKKAREVYKRKLNNFFKGKEKILEIKRKYKDADMILTKTERLSIYNYKLNNNTLIIGGSGAGKTRGYVAPNLLQAHSSFVITDPKGEVLEKFGYFLKHIKGYNIRVLNLDDKSKSDGYNPFVYIHPEKQGYEERVLMLIEAIIINTDGGEKKGGSDPFWDKAERLFLQAVFFFACDGFIEKERNMNTVLSLIGMLKIEEEQDNYDSDLDYFAKIFEREHGEDHIGVQQYKEFREKASGKTAKSIVISAVARLAPFRTKAIKKMFEYDSLYLDKVGEEKTAVFVVVPPTDSTFNFIAGMMFTQLFQELQYCATHLNKHNGQRLPVPVRFILDEFANTCTIPNFVKILAYARSLGIGISPILQSLEQIKNMYKDEWGVIVDNCNSLLYLGSITHMDTLEYMSKLVGKATFDKKTTGRSRGKQGSSSQNFDVVGRELMDASEIRKMEKEDCLLIIGGKDAFYSKKYEYKEHPNYRYTSDSNKEYSFDFMPSENPLTNAHGEQDLRPSENTVVNIEKIKMDENLQSTLNKLGKTFKNQIPVPNDELEIDEGESFTQEQELFNLIMEEDSKAEKSAANTLSEDTKMYLSKIEKINILPVKNQLANMIESAKNQIPVSNDELEIDEGEVFTEGDFQNYIFEGDETSDLELKDIVEEISNLNEAIDNSLEIKEEFIVVG